MRKLIFLWVLVLVLLPSINATYYDVDVTYDFENEMRVGETLFGNIIFEPIVVNFTTKSISEPTNYNVYRGDSIQNRFNYSIKVGDEILVQNEIFKMETYGDFEIRRNTNDTYLGRLSVLRPSDRTLYLTTTDDMFNVTFSDDDIDIENTNEFDINVTMEIPKVPPDEYTIDISYHFDDEPKITKEFDFDLLRYENFTVEIKNCTREMAILSHGVFCDFYVENTGNVVLDLDITMEGFAKYFFFPENVGVFPRDRRVVTAYYDLSREPPLTKAYFRNATFRSNNVEKTVAINFSFVDRVFPEVRNLSISNMEVFRPYNNTIEVFENYNLSSVKARIYHNENLVREWDLPKYKFNFYSLEFTPEVEGNYRVEVWAKDRAENLKIEKTEFVVTKLDAISDINNVRFRKVKFDNYRYEPLFYVDKDVEIKFEIYEINYLPNCTWEINIRNDDTGNEAFLNRVGALATFNKRGNYSIGLKGSCVTDLLNGQIKITVPNFHVPINNLVFSGQIIDYAIPENINEKQFNDGVLSCDVVDTGVVETSKYRCTIEYPLGDQNMDIMPVSVESYDKTIEEYESKIDGWKGKNTTKIILMVIMGVIILFLIAWVLFMFYVYPVLRFRLNAKQ